MRTLDEVSLAALFLISVTLMLVCLECGFRVGSRPGLKAVKAQASQVRTIMGAALALAAFMLAFAFTIAQEHYEVRVQNMVEEARIARRAFLTTDFLPSAQQREAQKILHDYVEERVSVSSRVEAEGREAIDGTLFNSNLAQARLLELAAGRKPERPVEASEFEEIVFSLMDIQALRMQAAFMNRISGVIWAMLFVVAGLSMVITGYQGGLIGRRSPLATIALSIAFSGVLALVLDLDRPFMSLFQIDGQIMLELLVQIRKQLSLNG
jgi:hypothetical protein